MASEITYAEVKFKNESTGSIPNSVFPAALEENTTPHKSNHGFSKLLFASLLIFLLLTISFCIAFIIFFQKYSQLSEKKRITKEPIHTALECLKKNRTMQERVWSCCPKNWKSFGSSCYFVSTEQKSWQESEKNCSGMGAHLLVINSQEEQEFITKDLRKNFAYYMGLSDPEGQRHWQWVDQTPYNKNVTFWHPGEPSDTVERCVIINFSRKTWGWNDARCPQPQHSICKMKEIFLRM
ncbi:C-type lectin domain family 4 member A-like isoform X2 [Tupaia chinensis]|uniref:C-type lectin domain family 4 member A-like isoform X2 n=1 Tax=Tupaia chinensis TaxID=246437 RepID=UPI0007044705|nr:C-type lectin domain family 4 member A-like isoform X2 [Tupaia chinensis]